MLYLWLGSCLLVVGCGGEGQLGGKRETAQMHQVVFGLWVGLDEAVGPGARFEGKWPDFVTWATQRGFNAVAIPIVDWATDPETEPTAYLDVTFADGTKLSGLGYPVSRAYPLKMLILQGHEKGLRFYADLSQLGRIASAEQLGIKSLKGRPLDTERVVQVAEAVLDLGADGIIGRYFPPGWVDAVAASTRAAGAVYISVDSERDLAVPGEYLEAQTLLVPEMSPREIARADYYYGVAKAVGKPAWMLTSCNLPDEPADDCFGAAWSSLEQMANAMLFRAVQSRPGGFFVRGTLRSVDAIPADLIPALADYASVPDQRPTLNLIVDAGENWRKRIGAQFDMSLEAIINGASAAGYRMLVTRTPSADAAAYYIYAEGGVDAKAPDLSPETVALLSGDKTILLQVATSLPPARLRGWAAVREAFGLGNEEMPRLTEPPSVARYQTRTYTLVPADLPANQPPPAFLALPADLDGIDALATAVAQGRRWAMVTSRKNEAGARRVFINGTALNREAALPICAVLSGQGLREPTKALCAIGTISMFLAADSDADVTVELPNGQRFRERLANGTLKTIDSRATEEIAKKRAELTSAPESATPQPPSPKSQQPSSPTVERAQTPGSSEDASQGAAGQAGT